MIELLKLCGFREHDIKSELPRVEKAFVRLGINARDIEQGKQRLTKYYDIQLEGVRKSLRLCVLELVNLVLARDEGKTKIIYCFMTPDFVKIQSAAVSRSKEVYAAQPTELFQLIYGCIFDKMVPVLEAAESRWLKAGAVAHCANVKAIAGLFALDLIPRPDLLVSSGFLCEVAPKTIDLLHELYDIPTSCLDTCGDREFREPPAAIGRTAGLAAKSMRKLTERVQELVGFEITDDMLREVLDAKGKLEGAVRRVQVLLEESDPIPISITHENIWRCLGGNLPLSIGDLSEATDAMNTLYEELQERVNKGLGVVPKGAPRVLTFCPSDYTDPRSGYLITQAGIAAVAKSFDFQATDEGGQPVQITAMKDPYEAISLKRQRSFVSLNLSARIATIIEGCRRLNVDGFMDRFHVGCRTVTGDAMMIKEALTTELGIPVLLIEWEDFDPRVFNHEEYKRRLEVFKTMMANRAS